MPTRHTYVEKAGFLSREPCPNDHRGTFAVLSESGLAMQEKMWTVYAEGIAEYFACHLDDAEVKVLQQVLKPILAAVDE